MRETILMREQRKNHQSFTLLKYPVLYCIVLIDVHLSQSFQMNSKCRRAESFEACCHYQWVLLNVQIISLLFPFTGQKYIYSPVSKVHAGSLCVSVIHQTLTWTTGSLTCVHSYACIYTRGWCTPTMSQHNILTVEKFKNL